MKGIPRELAYSSTKYDTLFGKDTNALMSKVVTNNIMPILDYKDNLSYLTTNSSHHTSKTLFFCIPYASAFFSISFFTIFVKTLLLLNSSVILLQ